jgi:Coenzyme PQQ synthesis protein D (PqqD)
MLKRNETVLWRELDGEAVLLDPAEGCTYNLNRVGTLIWKLIDGDHTASDIASAICQEFEVEHEQALQDMEHLFDEMRQHKLLQSDVSSLNTIV